MTSAQEARELARNWATETFPLLDADHPELVNTDRLATEIDYLMPRVPPNAGRLALEMFDEIIQVLDEASSPARAMLTLPFRETIDRLGASDAGIEACIDRVWDQFAAPNFYLLPPTAAGLFRPFESYQRAVDFEFVSARPVYAWYNASRELEWGPDEPFHQSYYLVAPGPGLVPPASATKTAQRDD